MLVWLCLVFVCRMLQWGFVRANCTNFEFPCNDGDCIEKGKWCDTTVDCKDDSDERYCHRKAYRFRNPNKCNESFFVCSNGPCIPLVGRCDGFPSCDDHSDEADCGTTTHATSTLFEVVTSEENSTLKIDESTIKDPVSSTHALIIEEVITGIEVDSEAILENVLGTEPRNSTFSKTEKPLLLTSSEHAEMVSDTLVHKERITDIPQADTAAIPKKPLKEKDITQGFTKINIQYWERQKDFAQKWLLSVHDQNYGWGYLTARAWTALHMSGDFMKKETEEKLLMAKQLHLKLSEALIGNQTEKMELNKLSLYINALLASCENPRNFYGLDLVDILRHRTSAAEASWEFVSPVIYLTLCVSKAIKFQDALKIRDLFRSNRTDKMGMKALAMLAATCITDTTQFMPRSFSMKMAKSLLDEVESEGLPENIWDLALLTQALNEAKINQDTWNRSEALNRIIVEQQSDGSWGDIRTTYYVLPILSGKSLASLSSHCSPQTDMGMTPVNVLLKGKENTLVIFSLFYKEPLEMFQSVGIRVSKSTSLFDMMRVAEIINPSYRFKYDITRGKPTVYSFGKIANDPEEGMYWELYVGRRNATVKGEDKYLVKYDGDIRTVFVEAFSPIVFWWRKSH